MAIYVHSIAAINRLAQMIQAWNGFISGWKQEGVYQRLDELETEIARLDQQKMNALFR